MTNILYACKTTGNRSAKDSFYTDKGSWDAVRIPLIKPYELLRLNGSHEWTMNLEAPASVTNIKELNIQGNIITIRTGQTYCNNIEVPEAWFVIVPEKHLEKCFDNMSDFNKYLLSFGNKNQALHNVEKVYETFNSKGSVDWHTDF